MKLHELSRGDKFQVEGWEDLGTITFSHLDGMYSFCKYENGTIAHFRWDTPVKKIT